MFCVNGPGILTLNFEKQVEHNSFREQKFQVSGNGLSNTFGVEAKDFSTSLNILNISTRAYYGHEISGVIEELNGEISLKHHNWYSYSNYDLPIFFEGFFESYDANQSYALTCFPQN